MEEEIMETTKDRTETTSQFLDLIFLKARTHSHWLPREVPDELLHKAYDLARMGPTSANCCPMRLLFIRSKEAKERLRPALQQGNVEKTMAAPVTAVIAYDLEFYEYLPKLYPHADAKSWFAGNEPLIQSTAFRNGTLQGAYFMLACRASGLDVGPMSGFDNAKADAEFFPDSSIKSNYLCNIGYGDESKLHPRDPRFEFEEVAKVI
jgi:3-hydroxypropanoate dehydrogenase